MEEQAGFRVGRGCRDQIFVMRQLAVKTIEKDGKMYATLILLTWKIRAHDKVWREDNKKKCKEMLSALHYYLLYVEDFSYI